MWAGYICWGRRQSGTLLSGSLLFLFLPSLHLPQNRNQPLLMSSILSSSCQRVHAQSPKPCLFFICKGKLLWGLGKLYPPNKSWLPRPSSLYGSSKPRVQFQIEQQLPGSGQHPLSPSEATRATDLVKTENHKGHDLWSMRHLHWFNIGKILSLSHPFQSSCFLYLSSI